LVTDSQKNENIFEGEKENEILFANRMPVGKIPIKMSITA